MRRAPHTLALAIVVFFVVCWAIGLSMVLQAMWESWS